MKKVEDMTIEELFNCYRKQLVISPMDRLRLLDDLDKKIAAAQKAMLAEKKVNIDLTRKWQHLKQLKNVILQRRLIDKIFEDDQYNSLRIWAVLAKKHCSKDIDLVKSKLQELGDKIYTVSISNSIGTDHYRFDKDGLYFGDFIISDNEKLEAYEHIFKDFTGRTI
uniref:Uncharacterized protein n=1 Tax=Oenococcus oeni TaxID=1247 RepID=Q9ZF10_OENOE|nr:hypothetical protein [Oenococcus oeni]